ncbi:phosphotransferase family protein [Mycobacterium sp. pUA109]|uniref:phosphotransferase family protein n=1 Tax=Mycobacterium sp. pUA109 TaxID=3238982 RepID=UPI00351B6F75
MALQNSIDTDAAAERLAIWLTTQWPGVQNMKVQDLTVPASAGLSNETVLFNAAWQRDGQSDSRAMVARVQPAGEGVFPTYDLKKEAKVLGALGANGTVPVPEIYSYAEDRSVFGAPFMVMERVDGRIPSDDPPFTAGGWVLDLEASQRTKMWQSTIEVLASIHGTDWKGLGLDFLDTPDYGSGLDAQLAYWAEFFNWAAAGEPNPTIEHALTWLVDHKPTDTEDKVLNWGDARVGNVIYGEDLAPVAVLDWEMVTLAPRELDLGWWFFLERHHTEGIGLPTPPGIPDRATTVARYEELTGYRVQNLEYYEIFAGARLSIIMVRAAHMMIAAGLLPPDAPMALSNPASQLLAKLLGLPAPTGTTTSFIGNR